MDEQKRKLRQEAAKAFMTSLDQFQDLLDADKGDTSAPASTAASKHSPPPKKSNPAQKNLDAFEEAVADIDAFMEKQKPNS